MRFLESKLYKNFLYPFCTNIIFPIIITTIGVYLGIVVQKNKENSDDREKAAQYMSSLSTDLVKDTVKLSDIIAQISESITGLDSALDQMQQPMDNINAIKLNYLFTMKYDWFPDKVNFTERTIIQLKYNGGLSLIDKKNVADGIAVYDVGKDFCDQEAQYVLDAYKELLSTEKQVYNYKYRIDLQARLRSEKSTDIKQYSNDELCTLMGDKIDLATTDRTKIIACYNDFAGYRASLRLYRSALKKQQTLTKELIGLIKKEYD